MKVNTPRLQKKSFLKFITYLYSLKYKFFNKIYEEIIFYLDFCKQSFFHVIFLKIAF